MYSSEHHPFMLNISPPLPFSFISAVCPLKHLFISFPRPSFLDLFSQTFPMLFFLYLSSGKKIREGKKKKRERINKVAVAVKVFGNVCAEGVLRAECWRESLRGLTEALQLLSCFQAPSEARPLLAFTPSGEINFL